jgi:hypothetical protein
MAHTTITKVTLAAVPAMPTSFVYEELVLHVQKIQYQSIEMTKFLDDRWKNEKNIENQLKSRSLTIVDPYGNSIANKYMDHELISTVFRKYKKNYVPKYLQQWIKIGVMNRNDIAPLNDCALKSTVSKYADGYQFITYGEVIVWIGNYEYSPPQKLVLRVCVTDTMEKIKMHLNERREFPNIELKSFIINPDAKPNEKDWDKGTTLGSESTIMSGQLYQDNYIIMAKIIKEKVNCSFFFSSNFTCFSIFLTECCYKCYSYFSSIFENAYSKNYHLRSEFCDEYSYYKRIDTKHRRYFFR